MNWIKEKIMKYIIGSLFDSKLGKIVFGWANGHKTQIGRAIGFISLIIAAAQTTYPELTLLGDVNTYYTLIASWIVTELGIQHAEIKKKQ